MAGPVPRVVGAERLAATLQAAERGFDDLIDEAPGVGEIVETVTREETPKKSGRLAAGVRRRRDGAELTEPYAGVIGYGWPGRNIAADGYPERVLERIERPVVDELEQAAQGLLDRVRGA